MSKFNNLKSKLAKEPGVKNPAGLAASIGRKKYGDRPFAAMANAGRKYDAASNSFKRGK